ncbi:MFS general substrate transporter [Neoconidiobolus thromboides FSU 785]|nr:MFS general substrate transporter [Neoconidiobolus thromboides FSU 785]
MDEFTTVNDQSIIDTKVELGDIMEESPKAYSKIYKWSVLIFLSFAAFLAPLSATIYFPSLAAIKEELETTDILLDITVSVYMLTLGLAPLFWGGIADRYGRKGVFLVSQTIFTLGSIGCALSNSIGLLIAIRVIQGIGASAPIVTGIGAIADIFPKEERGSAMSMFFISPLIGPVIGPIIGGFLLDAFGWRSAFWFVTILGGIVLLIPIFLIPESLPKSAMQEFPVKITLKPLGIRRGGPMFNPLSTLKFVRFPIVIIGCLCIAITFGSFFAVEASMSRVFPITYNLTPSQSGLTFIPLGVGCILGNFIGGKLSDMSYQKFKAVNDGNDPKPEVRLYGLWTGSLIEGAGLLMTAWFVTYKLHLASALTAGVLIGIGNTISLIACTSYLVDNFADESASIASCFGAFQLGFSAVLSAVNGIVLENLTFGGGITLYACLCFCVTIVLFVLFYTGEAIRKRTGPYKQV